MKNDVIALITPVRERDRDGFRAETGRHVLEVMADVRSVRYGEYYQAFHAGMNVQLTAAVNEEDYEAAVIREEGRKVRPALVEHDGTEYRIIRVYRKKHTMELTLQEVE